MHRDSYNDIPMFALTPHSFAMAQADDAVKEHAHYVVNTVKDAVNHVIAHIKIRLTPCKDESYFSLHVKQFDIYCTSQTEIYYLLRAMFVINL